jgi:hypothetical protein
MGPDSDRHALKQASSNDSLPAVDRALIALGCDARFIADLLGDLRQEYVDRAAHDGIVAAGLWYIREIVRSTPHLALSALRDGTPASRARLAASLLAVVVTLALATLAWVTRIGPPNRLVTGALSSDGIVVNNVGPVKLSTMVLDAAGHRLENAVVRYQRLSGIPIPVSARGVVKCTERGDAVLRASAGELKKDFVIHCLPVARIRAVGWGNFMLGDSARTLFVDAVGVDSLPVTRIAATLRVDDSTVATLDGSVLRPLRPGTTPVEIAIGDNRFGASVTVFEPVTTLETLKPDQRWVAVRVCLKRAESVRWPLPVGDFFLAFSTDTSDAPVPRSFGTLHAHPSVSLSVDGPIMCMPDLSSGISNSHCLARGPGATLMIRHSDERVPDVVGVLALERWGAR